VILAARSIYFQFVIYKLFLKFVFSAMLFCGMRETNENEITLVDTPADAFKVFRYF